MNEKKYEEAVKKLQEALAPTKEGHEIAGLTRRCLEEIFPELRESEDDRIRKEIIYHIQHCDDTIDEQTEKKMIAWLEKQGMSYTKRDVDDAYIKGMAFAKYELEKQNKQILANSAKTCKDEHNPADKVEPKFKVGDKIRRKAPRLYDKDMQVARIERDYYICNHIGKFSSEPISFSEESNYELVEQESADKIEPMFRIGDWVVNNDSGVIQHIKEIVNVNDETLYVFDEDSVLDINFQEQYHLWTIQDAKDGDVLACPLPIGYKGGEQIFIFKGINNRDYVDNCIEYYCRVCEGNFYENKNGYMGTTSTPLYPATKEQRELLFQKMHEAGYEFDFEKKELKKVEQKSAEESLSYGKTEIAEKLIALAECLEMDGECLFNELSGNDYGKLLRALARELTEIKPVEWSEEDEKMLNGIIDEIEANRSYAKSYDIPVYEGFLNWLKSLRPQKQWKPSGDQMEALAKALSLAKNCGEESAFDLRTLHEQLKKLTE